MSHMLILQNVSKYRKALIPFYALETTTGHQQLFVFSWSLDNFIIKDKNPPKKHNLLVRKKKKTYLFRN